jgi:hypothetical protein
VGLGCQILLPAPLWRLGKQVARRHLACRHQQHHWSGIRLPGDQPSHGSCGWRHCGADQRAPFQASWQLGAAKERAME